ncbi:TetR family transcriptional regulator [Streptomyces sp. NPDC050504]|uniref:TetR family transcriptional regulator n=1 Tax=Streptomyces sp. NPDC050504 TaxID=3365618 RepID=UPI003799C1DB
MSTTGSSPSSAARPLPLRERKKLRTRQELAAAALRLFAEQGFDATTVDEVVDAVEVSKSTFFRVFPAKEAAAIEAEAELWTACEAALEARALTGPVLSELHDVLRGVVTELGADWAQRYAATRRLLLKEPALMAYTAHFRTGAEQRIGDLLTARLGVPADDLRPRVLAQLTTTGWSIAARAWVHSEGRETLRTLLGRVEAAFAAIPASLELSAGE